MSATLTILALLAAASLLYLWLQTGDNQYRLEAVKRVAFGVPFLILMFLFGGLIGVSIVVTFVLDVIWQFATGREGWTPGGQVERLERWRRNNMLWLQTGRGEFQWIP